MPQDRFSNFFIRVHQSFLNEGVYEVKLYGSSAEGLNPVAKYLLKIRMIP
ncbi:MAG: hypothetical protein L0387_29490 [Acidobacteria bacterium]|nr:hypothetical protein [Acidobacteriota bacterium]MCI0625729.1 hypothetical protein [Acidobacteriota bacterium]MCI0719678.1 hypothetical protein [Acidobacteriota bacterium]